MATYEEIHGKRVKELSTDPTLNSSYEGQVWYNETTGTLRSVVSFGAWASISGLNTTNGAQAGTGTNTAGLIFGGNTGPGGPKSNATEEWNGSGFSVGGTLPFSRAEMGGAGTQTAGLGFGGFTSPPTGANATVEYDGSSWTSGNNMNNGRTSVGSAGTQTAALAFGGAEPSSNAAKTEEYDGTNWTTSNDMGSGRYQLMGNNVGTQTDGVCVGGFGPPGGASAMANVENYNGSTWTAGTNLPTAGGNQTRNGLSNTIMAAAGTPGPNDGTKCYTFDGTAWSQVGSLASPRSSRGGAGSSGGSIIAGATPYTNVSEEYNFGTNTVTAAAFSSMGAMGTSRYGHSAAGDKTAAVVVSGRPTGPSPTTNVEEYNGSTWSEVTNVPSGKFYAGGGMGTQTASIFAGGFGSPPQGVQVTVESYDGTNWTDAPSLNTGKFSACPAGTQTAGLLAGGSPSNNTSEEFNGSSWTEGNNLTESFDDLTGAGTQTAAIAMGGSGPVFAQTDTELYDGTNWTNGPTMSQGRRRASGAGTQTDALVLAGLIPGPAATTKVEGFDGTSFSSRPSLGTSRYYGYGFAAASGNAYIAGGLTSPGAPNHTTAAEEFTAEVLTAAARTLTTS